MNCSLGLIENLASQLARDYKRNNYLFSRSTDNKRASLTLADTGESEKLVFADHDLFDEITCSDSDLFIAVEGGDDFTAKNESKSLNTFEISVFNRHDFVVGEELLGVIVDKLSEKEIKNMKIGKIFLPVDEHVHVVFADILDLFLHLFFLSSFDFSK